MIYTLVCAIASGVVLFIEYYFASRLKNSQYENLCRNLLPSMKANGKRYISQIHVHGLTKILGSIS